MKACAFSCLSCCSRHRRLRSETDRRRLEEIYRILRPWRNRENGPRARRVPGPGASRDGRHDHSLAGAERWHRSMFIRNTPARSAKKFLKTKQPLSQDEMRKALAKFGVGMSSGPRLQQHLRARHASRRKQKGLAFGASAICGATQNLKVGLTHEFLDRQDGWRPLAAALWPNDAQRAAESTTRSVTRRSPTARST